MLETSSRVPRILVLGDLILDHYLQGRADRISPEAPVPVLLHDSEVYRLGGAANVALNLKELGVEVCLVGLLGSDYEGGRLRGLLEEAGLGSEGLFVVEGRPTTCKTRILAKHQQLLRYDREELSLLDELAAGALWVHLLACLEAFKPEVVVFQDYNKGLLSLDLIAKVLAWCSDWGVKTVVDPKRDNFLAYVGVSLFKPNLKELNEALDLGLSEQRLDLAGLEAAALRLEALLGHDCTVITLGAGGLYLKAAGVAGKHYPTRPRKVADVCGAGDTVISILAWGLAWAWEEEDLALLANLGGGQVCESLGVVPVSKPALWQEYEQVKKEIFFEKK